MKKLHHIYQDTISLIHLKIWNNYQEFSLWFQLFTMAKALILFYWATTSPIHHWLTRVDQLVRMEGLSHLKLHSHPQYKLICQPWFTFHNKKAFNLPATVLFMLHLFVHPHLPRAITFLFFCLHNHMRVCFLRDKLYWESKKKNR